MFNLFDLDHRPEIWVLLTHAVGDNEQCLALAEAFGHPFHSILLDWPASGRAQDRVILKELLREGMRGRILRHSISLRAPWPRLVICSGRRGDDVAFWIRRQSGGRSKVVTIGRAHAALADYDLVVASPQYLLPERANVIHLPIPISRVRTEIGPRAPAAQAIGPKPWFTILLGGRVNEFVDGEAALRQVALRAQLAATRSGGTVIVSTSRRTPPRLLAAVEGELEAPIVYRWVQGGDDNPYATLLRESAAVFVTGDSASMILDACHSGTPTYIIELPERTDFRRLWRHGFYSLMRHAARSLRDADLESIARAVDRLQEWLHAAKLLRYPRDLRRLHAAVFEMDLVRPAAAFEPSQLPARRGNDRPRDAAGLQMIMQRCSTWLPQGRDNPDLAAESRKDSGAPSRAAMLEQPGAAKIARSERQAQGPFDESQDRIILQQSRRSRRDARPGCLRRGADRSGGARSL
ncbi:ELM1/GtrOC1 family putative glycosyltransferase [Dongia sp. agr-C8]